VLALHVVDDRVVERVARHAHRLAVDDAGERDHGDVGGAAADVDDHVAGCLGDREARSDRRGHGFFNQVHFTRLGAVGAVLDGAALHLGDLRRHADDDARTDQGLAAVRLANEIAEHLLGGFEVGNHAVAHRLDGGDVAGGTPEHLLGVVADRLDLIVRIVDGDDGRFAEHDALPARVDAGIGGAKIDRQIVGEQR
jgi:hypothetical protein